jgi:hypothetical protein
MVGTRYSISARMGVGVFSRNGRNGFGGTRRLQYQADYEPWLAILGFGVPGIR